MKPVTELYEAAESAYRGAGDRRLGEAVLKFDIDMGDEHEPNRDMFEVLDLVATLPPERLGLVRWVAGLDPHVLRSMRQWLNGMRAIAMGPWAEGCRAAADGLESALFGNEGGAKEEVPVCTGSGCKSCGFSGGCDQDDSACDQPGECPDAGCEVCRQAEEQQPPHPMWGAVGNAVAAPEPATEDEIRDLKTRLSELRRELYLWSLGDRPQSPPAALLREERDLIESIEAKEDERDAAKPKPIILRAGKPPPFLRVGMKLRDPKRSRVLTVEGVVGNIVDGSMSDGAMGQWWAENVSSWPLAEDFAVEGES